MTFPTLVVAVFAILTLGTLSDCVVQKLEIYSEMSGKGDSITFESKVADLDQWRLFLDSAKSFCLTGWWYFYGDKNFEPYVYTTGDVYYERICENRRFTDVNSLRYVGPIDTRSVSVSIYNRTSTGAHGGREIVLSAERSNDFPFIPTGILLSGNSSWTVFSGNNFNGTSKCFSGSEKDLIYFTMEEEILSIERSPEGCTNNAVSLTFKLALIGLVICWMGILKIN